MPTITFEQIRERVARHNAASAAPAVIGTILTEKGHAAVAVSRLKAQIEALDADDRADLIHMLAQLARELRRAERVPVVA